MKQFPPSSRVRPWCILLGLVLVYANCYWTIFQEAIWYAWPTDAVPFSTVIVLVFALVLLNFALKRISPRHSFSHSELIVIYVMLSLSSAIANWNMLAAAVPATSHAFWFVTPENEWDRLVWPYLPRWLTIWDADVLRDFYDGGSTIFTLSYMKAWAIPVLFWTLFASVLFGSMLFISVILRKPWTERERLTYPIIQMPLEMMNPQSRFFSNRLMWLGFAIPFIIVMTNSIHFFYPRAPYIPVKRRNIEYLFTQRPWNAIGNLKISFYPFVIGMGFLMPLDLAFASWFFYLFGKVQRVGISMMGLQVQSRFPYFTEQSFGAVVTLFIFYLWIERHHLKQVVSTLVSRRDIGDAEEPMRYRQSVFVFTGCFLLLLVLCQMLGMSLWLAVVYLGIIYILSVVISRVRVELGMPVHDFEGMEPRTTLPTILGTRRLGPSNLTAFALLRWAETGDYNPHPMPHQLEGFKMAERSGMNQKKLLAVMIIAIVFSSFFTFVTSLQMYYGEGATSGRIPNTMIRWYGESTYSRLQNQLLYPLDADWLATSFMGVGSLFTVFLMLMRMRFIWWPFHPLGYVLIDSWAMYNLWVPVLISSIVKWMILRHGGLKAYRQALPFFWGLILGDFVTGGTWLAIGLLFNMPVYVFYL